MQQSCAGVAEAVRKELLMDMFDAAVSAVHPRQAVARTLRREDGKLHAASAVYALDSFDRIVVIGAGTAAAHMAAAAEEALGKEIHSGTIMVKKGFTAELRTVEQVEAAHPIPDKAGMQGTRKILDMLRGVDARTLVICLLSGGASALLVNPLPGVSLEDKQKCIDLLLRASASVYELNTVCKHLSGVKGGRLARAAYPAALLTLTLSDVVGDRIDVIGSGPTAPGNSTFCEAARIIEKFELRYKLPEAVVALIDRGTKGQEPETADSTEACFLRTRHVIVGGMAQALFLARSRAEASGYAADLMINEVRGPVRQAARILAKKAARIRDRLDAGERRCLLFGGESTAAAVRSGRGCRNQELALAFAQEIDGIPGITFFSADTRGADGAVVDWTTASFARARGLCPEAYLRSKDSHAFFTRLDSFDNGRHHIKTGRTVADGIDLQMILVEG